MRNVTRLTTVAAPVLLAGLLCVEISAQGQGRGSAAPQTAQASAAFDITGYWVAVITQDWRLRMVMPPKGDYMGFPMTVESKKVADVWDPAKDEAAGERGRMPTPCVWMPTSGRRRACSTSVSGRRPAEHPHGRETPLRRGHRGACSRRRAHPRHGD